MQKEIRGPFRRWAEALLFIAAAGVGCWFAHEEELRSGNVTRAFVIVVAALVVAQAVTVIGRPRSRIVGVNDLWRIAMGLLAWHIGRTLFDVFGTLELAAPATVAFIIGIVWMRPLHLFRHPDRMHFTLRRWFDEEAGEVYRWRLGWFQDPERFAPLRFVVVMALVAAPAFAAPIARDHFVDKYRLQIEELVDGRHTALESTHVLAADGKTRLCTFTAVEEGAEHCRKKDPKDCLVPVDREVVPIKEIPRRLQQAFISAEDRTFRDHRGLDVIAVVRALVANWDELQRRIVEKIQGRKRPQRKKLQGGSTITQQAIKKLIIKSDEQDFERKVAEAFLAPAIERMLADAYKWRSGEDGAVLTGKDQLLELYLNHNYLGGGSHGVLVAARRFFGKELKDLTLGEMALIAGMAKAPGEDAPTRSIARAKERRAYVLTRMFEDGVVAKAEAEAAMREPIEVALSGTDRNKVGAPHVCEDVRLKLRDILARRYGAAGGREAFYRGRMTAVTSIKSDYQRKAEYAVAMGLLDLERRLAFGGPIAYTKGFDGRCSGEAVPDEVVVKGTVSAVAGDRILVCAGGESFPLDAIDVKNVRKWEAKERTRLAVGHVVPVRLETRSEERKVQPQGKPGARPVTTKVDVRYALTAHRHGDKREEVLQAGMYVIGLPTGEAQAIVGGYLAEDAFNHARFARRQAGSAIKPIGPYAAALRAGLSPLATMVDTPRTYSSPSGPWRPKNYEGKFRGTVTLKKAMADSLNSIAVELCFSVAGLDNCIQTLRDLGVESKLDRVLPLAVGAAEITLEEMTYAFASVANWGRRMPRHEGYEREPGFFIREIRERRPGTGYPLTDQNSKRIWPAAAPKGPAELGQAIPSGVASALVYLMREVTKTGTAWRLRDFGLDLFGKTGTTNDAVDAWFVGCSPDICVGVWVGRANKGRRRQAISEGKATGGTIALPIWTSFMESIRPGLPRRAFPTPWDVSLEEDEDGQMAPVPIIHGAVRKRHGGGRELSGAASRNKL